MREGQGHHEPDSLAHRLEEPRHDREDQQQGEEQVLQEFLLLVPAACAPSC
jgi:hypothetical protein